MSELHKELADRFRTWGSRGAIRNLLVVRVGAAWEHVRQSDIGRIHPRERRAREKAEASYMETKLTDIAAVRKMMSRLNRGRSGWLLYDHEHRSYTVTARMPNGERGFDVIGFYAYGASREDLLADIGAYEAEHPQLRRRPAQGGRRAAA